MSTVPLLSSVAFLPQTNAQLLFKSCQTYFQFFYPIKFSILLVQEIITVSKLDFLPLAFLFSGPTCRSVSLHEEQCYKHCILSCSIPRPQLVSCEKAFENLTKSKVIGIMLDKIHELQCLYFC